MRGSFEDKSCAKVRTFNRVETLNLFVTRTKTYSNSDVVLTAPAQKHLSPEEYHTQASKQGDLLLFGTLKIFQLKFEISIFRSLISCDFHELSQVTSIHVIARSNSIHSTGSDARKMVKIDLHLEEKALVFSMAAARKKLQEKKTPLSSFFRASRE